jgi:predicted MPP superfamily phosphohydrolase
LFGIVLTTAFTVLLAYVTWRATSVPFVARWVSRRGLLGAALGSWVLFLLARYYGHHGTGVLAVTVELLGVTLLGSVFLVALALLVVDLATGFGWLFSRWAPRLRGWALLAGAALSVIALVQGFRAPAVSSHEVTLRGLPAELDGTVLVAVSDTHVGGQLSAQWLEERMVQVEALGPDLVLFLGDIFEGHGDVPRDIPALRQLSAPLGKWFVLGNHEAHGDGEAAMKILERAGFRRLANRAVEVAPGLILTGVDDLTRHRRRRLGGDPLGRALAGRPPGASVLLSHTPWQAERAARAGVGLMLSGHTHGGQIWPLGYLVRTAYPLLAGRYDVQGMSVIVCRGTGTWGPRMRLWQRGEILKVTLRCQKRP